jgi:putative tricarboxylic transport membrane protein
MSNGEQPAVQPRLAVPEFLIGLGMLAASGAALWQTLAIPISPLYSKVGPTVFPYITTVGMTVLSVLLIVKAVRGGWQPEEEKETPTDWKAMGFVVAGLVRSASPLHRSRCMCWSVTALAAATRCAMR